MAIFRRSLLPRPRRRPQTPSPAEAAAATAGKDRILLVLPFDNRTGQPSLEWIREAAAALLSSRFTSAGFAPMSRADRLYALDHLGLAAGISAIARQFAETGPDAGRRLHRGGQLHHRRLHGSLPKAASSMCRTCA